MYSNMAAWGFDIKHQFTCPRHCPLLPSSHGFAAWICSPLPALLLLLIIVRRRRPSRLLLDLRRSRRNLGLLCLRRGELGGGCSASPAVRLWFGGGLGPRCCLSHCMCQLTGCWPLSCERLQLPRYQRWFLRSICRDRDGSAPRNRCMQYSSPKQTTSPQLLQLWRSKGVSCVCV